MKTRTFRGLVVMVLTMASMAAMASMASAQVTITDSANGTGNTINAGGGFGPTEIRNSANGDYNTINAERSYRHAIEPQSYYRTYTTVRREVYPTYRTWHHSYPSVTRYQAAPQVRYAYPAPAPAPYVDQVRYAGPQTYPGRTWSGGTEIRNSANGTGNTINAQGGFGASVFDSANGENNTINIGQ